jgi:hypothetical protein
MHETGEDHGCAMRKHPRPFVLELVGSMHRPIRYLYPNDMIVIIGDQEIEL